MQENTGKTLNVRILMHFKNLIQDVSISTGGHIFSLGWANPKPTVANHYLFIETQEASLLRILHSNLFWIKIFYPVTEPTNPVPQLTSASRLLLKSVHIR